MMAMFRPWVSRTLLAFALFAGGALPASASTGGAAAARDLYVQLCQLSMEVSMMVYDETSDVYRKQARAAEAALQEPAAAVVKDLSAQDAAAGAGAAENFRVMHGSMVGGGEFGEGLLNSGYEAKPHGDYDDNLQQLLAALDKGYNFLGAGSSVETRAYVLVARTVSAYVRMSASPFGSYTASFNTEDSDLTKQVTRVDAVLAELAKKHAADKEKSQRVKRVNAKWQFIRTTILKAGSQATPFIVYRHGGDIMRELKAFN